MIIGSLNAAQKIYFLYIRRDPACTSFRNHPAVSCKATGHVPALKTASDTLAWRNTHHDSTFDWLVDWTLTGLASQRGEASEGGASWKVRSAESVRVSKCQLDFSDYKCVIWSQSFIGVISQQIRDDGKVL